MIDSPLSQLYLKKTTRMMPSFQRIVDTKTIEIVMLKLRNDISDLCDYMTIEPLSQSITQY